MAAVKRPGNNANTRIIRRLVIIAMLWGSNASPGFAQHELLPENVPASFKADSVFAAQARPRLFALSMPATGGYSTGAQVLELLVAQLPAGERDRAWTLRVARNAGNMFSSPDGSIFVDEDLARVLGAQRGLWAAAIAHEISHVVRRDWARRYLYQRSIEESAGGQISLGAVSTSDSSWFDPSAASSSYAAFCQKLEVEADAEGLVLMARAGFHPAFMPALYHLLHAQPHQIDPKLLDASHPLWDERDAKLRERFLSAGKEFDRLWPEPFGSPGGNPPVVVYAGPLAKQHMHTGEVRVTIPLRCENLYGSLEVVLRLQSAESSSTEELHQYTGCTSSPTHVMFTLNAAEALDWRSGGYALASVLDESGAVLARTLSSKHSAN
jgi:Zn-dependent protease with chaperone function